MPCDSTFLTVPIFWLVIMLSIRCLGCYACTCTELQCDSFTMFSNARLNTPSLMYKLQTSWLYFHGRFLTNRIHPVEPENNPQWLHLTLSLSIDFPFPKALDTFGYCQRPVFSLGISQYKHKITNLWKFKLNWLSKLRDNNERRKKTLVTWSCALSDAWFPDLKI